MFELVTIGVQRSTALISVRWWSLFTLLSRGLVGQGARRDSMEERGEFSGKNRQFVE